MKRIAFVLVGFLIGYLAPRLVARAQGINTVTVHDGPSVFSDLPKEHPRGPSMREIIEVLADYEVRHIDVPYNVPWYGMTVPDQKAIFLVNMADVATRRKAVIHELTHATLRLRGDMPVDEEQNAAQEEAVKAIADIEYQKLFGGLQ